MLAIVIIYALYHYCWPQNWLNFTFLIISDIPHWNGYGWFKSIIFKLMVYAIIIIYVTVYAIDSENC